MVSAGRNKLPPQVLATPPSIYFQRVTSALQSQAREISVTFAQQPDMNSDIPLIDVVSVASASRVMWTSAPALSVASPPLDQLGGVLFDVRERAAVITVGPESFENRRVFA